jgi:hypothetical protein
MAEAEIPQQWNLVTKGEGLCVEDLKLPYGRLIRTRTWDPHPDAPSRIHEQILFYPFATKLVR